MIEVACFWVPLPLFAAPEIVHRVESGLPVTPFQHDHCLLEVALILPAQREVSALSLTSQARSVRVYIPRRAIHASCDSPCHLSAKHGLLRTCLPRTAPFRSMLLTLRGGPQC